MRLSLSIPAALLALAGFVSASNVVDLDPASFDAVSLVAAFARCSEWNMEQPPPAHDKMDASVMLTPTPSSLAMTSLPLSSCECSQLLSCAKELT